MIRVLLLIAGLTASVWAQTPPSLNDAQSVASFEALIKGGHLSEAQTALHNYTNAHPESWREQYQLGYVYFRLHQIQLSVVHLCKSLVLNDQFAESHKVLAYDLNILGHPDRAIVELERSIHIDPFLAESHYELGRIYYEQGSYLQSVDHLERAKSLAPDLVRVYHNLALAYGAIAENAKAVDNFEKALRLNRQSAKPSAWPMIDYGTYLNLQGEFGIARTMLLEAISIDARWDQAFYELSKADRGLGRLPDSISALQCAVAINGAKPEYHYVLAQLYKQTGRSTESEQQITLYRSVLSEAQKQSVKAESSMSSARQWPESDH